MYGDALGAAAGDDAEQDALAVSALGAAGEEHVETELRDVLKLALGRRVVDRDLGVVDEAEEGVAVIVVVANRRRQRLGGRSVGATAWRHRAKSSAVGRMRRCRFAHVDQRFDELDAELTLHAKVHRKIEQDITAPKGRAPRTAARPARRPRAR